ncbi:unnamed protein product [Clavelina lepadiformis]|uniref:Uncharacterized protein n=1 Tax=Clavelina lepadiformis TaxID=159417 RepID=A0ABP0GW94_CLALP
MDRNFNDGNVGNNSMAFSSCKVCDDCNIGVKRKLYSQSENEKYLKKSRTDTEAVSRINRSNKVFMETNEELEDPRATASDVERSNLQENYPPPPSK